MPGFQMACSELCVSVCMCECVRVCVHVCLSVCAHVYKCVYGVYVCVSLCVGHTCLQLDRISGLASTSQAIQGHLYSLLCPVFAEN